MRVASKTIYEAVKFNLGNITENLYKAHKVVATGKRITGLSDDPVGLTQVLNIKSTLSNITQLGRNIDLGKSWLIASESALSHVQNLISEARVLCVQMATETMGAAQRTSAAETVQNTLEEIVSLANTDVNGRYIFAGSKTDAAPFSRDNDTNVVTYNGDNNAFTIKIGRDATVQVGSDGEAVFGTAGQADDIFKTFIELKADLVEDNVTGIGDAITKLDTHFDHISTKISDIGSKIIRMEIKTNIFQDLNLANIDRLSNIEDADITEAIMDLKSKELAYQAASASSARVMELSLIDYL